MTAPFDFNDSLNFKQVMRDYLSAMRHKLFNHSFHFGSAPPIFPQTTIMRRRKVVALPSQTALKLNFRPLAPVSVRRHLRGRPLLNERRNQACAEAVRDTTRRARRLRLRASKRQKRRARRKALILFTSA
jgi:hypothetical protein